MALDPTTTALGTWSGGHFMHYGEPLAEDRLLALLRPDERVRTVLTADVYGEGAADTLLGRALDGLDRDAYCLVGAVGHDFVKGAREGPRGFPRFTDPRLREPAEYGAYLRDATEASLRRLGAERFDLLMLHNPDRTGYEHSAVWEGMAALRDTGLTRLLGIAPGPANGFTLDLISCLERYGELIDWAMIILGPLEPWPGELVLGAARTADVGVITRVVDYGGLFHEDVLPGHEFAPGDHRGFRPAGWVDAGRQRMEAMRPIAEAHGLSMLQLACAWNLAHPAVRCVVPTLIQEVGPHARPVEDKREELASLPDITLAEAEVDELRRLGDNTGCMALKGASVRHEGDERADAWPMGEGLGAVAERWGIDPARDLLPA